MKERPAIVRWLGTVVGLVLIAAGLVLLVVPGPGIPLLVLGLAFAGSQSRLLAKGLDRAELAVRPHAQAAARWLRRMKRRALAKVHQSRRAASRS